ncbi:Phospholipase A [Parasponia andersonii]|uniref:Phospholipase A n=1 Tax=Parasponia andersonii TaxID=3476 RepID=A0A2P5E1V2_PARAD|nr:Phospholipase A [Parasponia andersonii]
MIRNNYLLNFFFLVFFLFSLNCFSPVDAYNTDLVNAFKTGLNDHSIVRKALNSINDLNLGCVLNIDDLNALHVKRIIDTLDINLDALKTIGSSKFLGVQGSTCSRTCRSDCSGIYVYINFHFNVVQFGKMDTGCPGEKACDGLDACCMVHDACVGENGYLSEYCNQNLLNCMTDLKKSGGQYHAFEGNKCDVNKVICDISFIIKIAVLAGQSLPDKH